MATVFVSAQSLLRFVMALLLAAAVTATVNVAANDAPTVSSVAITSDPADDVGLTLPFKRGSSTYDSRTVDGSRDTYAVGDTIQITVTFSNPVSVTGDPSIALTVGAAQKTAAFASSNQNDVVFEYQVVEGDMDADGIETPANGLSLNGGSIQGQGQGASDAVITHAALGAQAGHKVDGVPPTLVSVNLVPNSGGADGVYSLANSFHHGDRGDQIGIQALFSEAVYVSVAGPPRLRLQVGNDSRWAYSESFPWGERFLYEVREGDLDLDGVSFEANAIDLNGGTIQDAAGNNAVGLNTSAVADNSDFVVDGVKPTVKYLKITSQPSSSAGYGVGSEIQVTVTFSEDVKIPERRLTTVTGSDVRTMPHLALKVGLKTRRAEFESVSGPNAIFTYTVQNDDRDLDGVSIEANALSLDTGYPMVPAVIRDATGDSPSGANDADIEHAGLVDDVNHKVDGSSQTLTLSGDSLVEYSENSTATVTLYTVSHARGDISWSLSGVDRDEFAISVIGELTFKSPPNYEAPTDANSDNQYSVTVEATDGTDKEAMDVIVKVNNEEFDADEIPTIDGTARAGQTLTSDISNITFDDKDPKLYYRWYRSDGTTDTEIEGARRNTSYTLTADDIGSAIKVSVSFWAGADGDREYITLTSEPTDTVEAGGL